MTVKRRLWVACGRSAFWNPASGGGRAADSYDGGHRRPESAKSGHCEIRILAAKGQVIRLYIDDPVVVERILDHLE